MSLATILKSLISGAFSGSQLDDLDIRDDAGARWVRDWQAEPGQSSTAIVASSTALAVQTPPVTFRALRFGSPTPGTTGTVTVTYIKADGTQDVGIVEGVTAGEVWSISSASIYSITAISGVTVRGLG